MKIVFSIFLFVLALPFAAQAEGRSCSSVFSSDAKAAVRADLTDKTISTILNDLLPEMKTANVRDADGDNYPAEVTFYVSGVLQPNKVLQINPTDGRMSMNLDKSYDIVDANAKQVAEDLPLFNEEIPMSQSSVFKEFLADGASSFVRIDVAPEDMFATEKAQQYLIGFDTSGSLKVIYILQAKKFPFGGGLGFAGEASDIRRIIFN